FSTRSLLSYMIPINPSHHRFPYTTLFRSHMFLKILFVDDDFHALSTKYIRRSYQNREVQYICNGRRFISSCSNIKLRIRNVVFLDRKSTRLNSSHVKISYAVFCLKKKNKK